MCVAGLHGTNARDHDNDEKDSSIHDNSFRADVREAKLVEQNLAQNFSDRRQAEAYRTRWPFGFSRTGRRASVSYEREQLESNRKHQGSCCSYNTFEFLNGRYYPQITPITQIEKQEAATAGRSRRRGQDLLINYHFGIRHVECSK